jgi:hypothetical protein
MPPIDRGITAGRRGKGWLIATGIAIGLMCLALAIVGFLYAVRSIANGIGQGLSGLGQSAAAKAWLADDIARANHIPDGALTPALLNAQRPTVRWISGGDSVPMVLSGRTDVSISTAGNHVVTAVYFGTCEYGLTVATQNDPIIGLYGLPGVGTYFVFPATPGSPSACTANSAPTSGWERADRSVVKVFNKPPLG